MFAVILVYVRNRLRTANSYHSQIYVVKIFRKARVTGARIYGDTILTDQSSAQQNRATSACC
jgi:hypothetical protein